MKLSIAFLYLFNLCSSLKPKLHFFFRTAHPDVDFHQKRLAAAKESVLTQAKALSVEDRVFADNLENREDYYSHFLIVNALPYVKERLKENTGWIFIGEETTRVELEFLLPFIDGLDKSDEPVIIGRPLFDQEMTIIHHFFGANGREYKTFGFPDYEAGFLINIPLMNALIR